MSRKILTLEQLLEVVRQTNKIEHRLAVAPVQSRGMNISVHQTVLMDVCNRCCNLPKYQEESRSCGH